jgi:hypothetical protein
MSYVICEYEKVREQFPQFLSMMKKLRSDLIAECNAKWGPSLTFGGMSPKSGQFGESTIMPQLFYGWGGIGYATATPPAARLTTWHQKFHQIGSFANSIPGSLAIIEGAATGGTITEDYMLGLAGVAFLDKAIKVSEIKMQIGNTKIPRINLEEAMVYNKPAVVFEQPHILTEEEGFEMLGYVTAEGFQTIKLIGLQMNRVPNKLQVSNTGALL